MYSMYVNWNYYGNPEIIKNNSYQSYQEKDARKSKEGTSGC